MATFLLLAGIGMPALRTQARSPQRTTAGNPWLTTGNSIAATSFLGTTNNRALVFKVNKQRALVLEPNATSPNLIGGYKDNAVTAGVAGATIGGGGQAAEANRVTDNFGTVGGREQKPGGR